MIASSTQKRRPDTGHLRRILIRNADWIVTGAELEADTASLQAG